MAADPWSILPVLSQGLPTVALCYSDEHNQWYLKMAEVVALKAFLKVTPKLYKPELAKVLKDVPGAGKPSPVDPSLAASKY